MKPRMFQAAVIIVLAVTLTGAAWETVMVSVFARRAGQLKGMIANPRPYDYVNYDYTPNGRQYELWAFKVPFVSTATLMLVAGTAFTVTLVRARGGRRAIALWSIIVMCSLFFFALTACYYVAAVNVFI